MEKKKRGHGFYQTGDVKVDSALFHIHNMTMHDPADFNLDGQSYDGFLVSMIEQMRQLPEEHPVRLLQHHLMTSGAHTRWDVDRCRAEYSRLTKDLWPVLDATAPKKT